MKAVLKLINSYYFKGFFGPFFTIVFPVIMLFIMGNAMDSIAKSTPDPIKYMQGVVSGIMITSLISIGIMGFPIMIIEFKKSTLMKRIGAAHISKKAFFLVVISYQSAWAIFAVIWTLLWGGIIIGTKSGYDWSIAFPSNLGISIPFIILTLLTGLSLGLIIVSIANTAQAVMGLSNVLYIPIAFLSGSFLPIDQVRGSTALNGLSYALPTKYAIDPFFTAFRGGAQGLADAGWESWAFPLIALGFIGIAISIAIKKFRWGN